MPENDQQAETAVRALGYPTQTTETMVRLYQVIRAQGHAIAYAYERTLLASLSTETLRETARTCPGSVAVAETLAKRLAS